MNILVVEDEAALLGIWLELFAGAGHQVVGVLTLQQAREQLHLARFDVVVLDLFIKRQSTLPLATLATYANPECRVVVVTGWPVFPMGELMTLAPSVAAVLRKPVCFEDLLAICEHAVSAELEL